MKLLGIDIGSSSVKAGVLVNGALTKAPVRVAYPTRVDGAKVEIDADDLLRAIARAVREVGRGAKRVDAISLAAMAPSWVAMDSRGRAITPIVTHQDRRAVAEAHEIEKRVGRRRHLRLAGNRPFPGGISSTTFRWFVRHEPAVMRLADLAGHVTTLLHRQMTAARVTDPSNASFMGLYSTLDLRGWSEELCAAALAKRSLLPEIREANEIAGRITRDASRRFGLTHGTPMFVGMMDTSSVLLLAGGEVGRLVNSCGSTDVLAVCTDRPIPHERLLTRAVGIGRRWMSVATLAAAGSAIDWVKHQLFADLSWDQFNRLLLKQSRSRLNPGSVSFAPHLAGDRTAIDQPTASFTGLTLATTRETMLAAVIDSLARASAARLGLLREANPAIRFRRDICLTGGASPALRHILHRDWRGGWRFADAPEATLRGLAKLA